MLFLLSSGTDMEAESTKEGSATALRSERRLCPYILKLLSVFRNLPLHPKQSS